MGNGSSKCTAKESQKAMECVPQNLLPYFPKIADTGKKLNIIHDKFHGMMVGEGDFEKKYYNDEMNKLTRNLKQKQIEFTRNPDQLKQAELNEVRFIYFGNPNSSEESITKYLTKYTNELRDNFSKISKKITDNAKAHHENYEKELITMLTHYKSQEAYSRRMQNLLTLKEQEHKELMDELEKLTKTTQTDNRKAQYETEEISSLHSTRKIMFYIYYLLFVLYLIFGSFFTDKKYRNVTTWIYMTLFLTLPFYISYISNGIIYLYRQFLYFKDNKLPKNVYTDL